MSALTQHPSNESCHTDSEDLESCEAFVCAVFSSHGHGEEGLTSIGRWAKVVNLKIECIAVLSIW